MPDLDSETQHALFPNFPTADANSTASRRKWSDIGTAPALHHFAQRAQHPTAGKAVACSRHEQEAHDEGASMALPNIPPTTAKQQASAEHCTPGDRKASNKGRSAPTSRRSSPVGVHTGSPAYSPDPEHYLVSLRWGSLSTRPLHPQLPTPQHSSTCLSGSTSQSPSPPHFSTSYSHYRASRSVPLKALIPNKGLPSEPRRSHIPCSSLSEGLSMVADGPIGDEARIRSASPCVARACVTLPGFCPRAKVQCLAEGLFTEEQHKPAAIAFAGKHALQSVRKAFDKSTVSLISCSAVLSSMCLLWCPMCVQIRSVVIITYQTHG